MQLLTSKIQVVAHVERCGGFGVVGLFLKLCKEYSYKDKKCLTNTK